MTATAEPVAAVSARTQVRKPRLGFLGLGWIGENRLKAIAHADIAEIKVIVDPVQEMLRAAAQHAPDALRSRRFEDLFAIDLDAVVIATPSAHHAAQAIAALDRGLGVFCQKPLGRNLAEVRQVVNAARAADRLLGVDLSYRATTALRKLRELIHSGELGDIFAIDLVFHNAYGPQKPWFYDPLQAGGGCVVDLGIHLIDAALWILNEPIVRAASRLFHEGKLISGRADVCEDYATARFDLANGAVLSLSCSWHLHAGRDAIIKAAFYGTKGGAAMRNVNGSFYDFVAERFTKTARQSLAEPPDDWFGRAAVEWVDALAKDSSYDPGIEGLLEVHAALDAIYDNANS